MKYCSKCKIRKDARNFHKCVKHKDGLRYECKTCSELATYAWLNKLKTTSPDKFKELCRKRTSSYRAKYPEKYKILNRRHQKTWRDRNPDTNRLRAKLGLRTARMYKDILILGEKQL